MKFATISTSWITEAFIDASRLVEGMTLHAVYSREANKAEAFRVKHSAAMAYDDYDKMLLEGEIDAVYVGSPNMLHYEHSKKALLAGKHVICEKPITVNSDEVRELNLLARSKGLIYIEAIMFLHTPNHMAMLSALEKIGKISAAVFNYSQLSSKYSMLQNNELPNIFNPEMRTGCLMDIGVYNVYTAIVLFGYPEKITSSATFLPTGADACGTIVFEYKDKLVTLIHSKIGQHYAPSEIYGDKGTISFDSMSLFQPIRITRIDKSVEAVYGEDSRTVIMSCEARRFYNYIAKPDEYKEEYIQAQEYSYLVSRAMEEIRKMTPGFLF